MGQVTRYEAFIRLDTGTHSGDIRQLAVTADGSTLVSAGEGTIRVWDIERRQLRGLLLGEMAGGADEALGNGDVRRFALSHDGAWVVVLRGWFGLPARGSDDGRVTEVQVFELATGNLQSCFVYPGLLLDLAFSPNGRLLAMVGNRCHGARRHGLLIVYDARAVIRAGFDRPPRPLAQARCGAVGRAGELPLSLRFVPALHHGRGSPLVVAGNPMPGATKDRRDDTPAGFLAWYRFNKAVGLVPERQITTATAIDPATLAVSHQFVVVGAAPPPPRRKRSWGQLLCHDHHGQPVCELKTEAIPAAATFSPDGSRLLVGLSFVARPGTLPAPGEQTVQVNAYDTQGGRFDLRSTHFGHDATVAALVFLDNERVASAGGDNQAIHFWRCNHRVGVLEGAIRGVGQTCYAPGIDAKENVLFGTVPLRLLPENHAQRQQAFDLRCMALRTTSPSAVRNDYESRKWFIMDNAAQTIPLRYSPDAYGDNLDLPPDLTLFVGADDEWVIWTRSGYYDASPSGAARIGYHVNRGPHKEALFFPSDRFKAYYRPDLVAAVVRHGTEARANAHAKWLAIAPLDVASRLPPIVEFDRKGVTVAGDQVSLRFSAEVLGSAEPLTRVWVLKNDRFAWAEPVPDGQTRSRHVVTLRLSPGRNVFSIRAETAQAKSMPLTHEVTGPTASSAAAPDSLARGNLYLLSVGVSDFAVADTPEAGAFQRLTAAHQDAIAVHNALATSKPSKRSKQSHRLDPKAALGNMAFDTVTARVLVNEAATKAAILAALNELCAEIALRNQREGAERDVLFVFLSGHGVRFSGEPDLYFWNHDLRPSKMEETGLSLVELGEIITSVPAEVVLAIDACHAGMAGNNVMRSLDAEELARRIHAVNERGLYVLNAARAEEKAREDRAGKLGVFTGAMLATLTSKRFVMPDPDDTSRRAIGMLGLIAGVQHFVPQMTERAGTRPQTPVCRMYGDLLPLTIYKS